MFDPRIEIPPGNPVVWGEFTNIKLNQAPGSPGHVSNMVVDPSRPFKIDLEWKLDGELGNVNGLLNDIGNGPGTKVWHVHVYAEKMGPGEDLEIYHATTPEDSVKPVTAANFPAKWNHTCEIPPGTLRSHAPGSGMYRLCSVVFANTSIPGCDDIIGCCEGPMILAEDPSDAG